MTNGTSQWGPPSPENRSTAVFLHTEPGHSPDRHRRIVLLRIAATVLAVGGLVVAAGLVLTRNGGPDPGTDSPLSNPPPTTAASAPADFAPAHEAFLAGDCDGAVALYDEALDDAPDADSDAVATARFERDECAALLAATQGSPAAPELLIAYVEFMEGRMYSALSDVVRNDAQALVESAGAQLWTVATCDELNALEREGIVADSDDPAIQISCAVAYDAAGRADDSLQFAMSVLSGSPGPEVAAQASALVVDNPAACGSLDLVRDLTGIDARPDELATLLHTCIADALSADNLTGAPAPRLAASLQIEFLASLATHPDAPAVEAALLENTNACQLLDQMRTEPAIAIRSGFVATKTLTCAQFSDFVGDRDAAMTGYQWFLDNAGADPRVSIARDGLARLTHAKAREDGADIASAPERSGSSGSSLSRVVIYNDSPNELKIVVSGPESRIEVVPASPTSSEYSTIGPLFCRTDVPSITIDLLPGTYDVLVSGGSLNPVFGSWPLAQGAEYSTCYFVVTTFG